MRACTKGGDAEGLARLPSCCQVWAVPWPSQTRSHSHPMQSFLLHLGPRGSSQIPQPHFTLQHSLSTNYVPRIMLGAGDAASALGKPGVFQGTDQDGVWGSQVGRWP